MKTSTKVLLILATVLAVVLLTTANVFLIAPSRFTTRYETLSSPRIGEQLDDVHILFFSDLDYGSFMDEERLAKLRDHINDAAPDVVIFGGDIYDTGIVPSDAMTSTLTDAFSSIKAPLGKFAVYGDRDEANDTVKTSVDSILTSSDFEVLNNRSLTIHNGGSDSITLVGLDNKSGSPDPSAAYSSVSRDSYVLTVCHTPDSADDVPKDLTSYFLAGHSHGGQVYTFFSAMYTPPYAEKYFRGKNEISDAFTLDITNGVGTTGKDVRMFADAEVVQYTLEHASSEDDDNKETSAPAASPSAASEASGSPVPSEAPQQEQTD